MNKGIKIFINYFLGPALFIWFGIHIWQQIRHQDDLQESWQAIVDGALSEQWWKWILLVLLMLLNWGIEAQKWHQSIRLLQKISFWKSFRAILTGLSFAVNTPNRIGEYLGRVLYVEEGNRIKAVSVTLVNSWSQLIITLIGGSVGLIYMRHAMSDATIEGAGLSVFWIKSLQWGTLAVTLVFLAFYLRLGTLVFLMERMPFIGRFRRYFQVLQDFRQRELVNMLMLSFLRYLVFILQYQLVFSLFAVNLSWWQGFGMTSIVFLILAIIPTIALAELGLRGEISLQLIGMLSKNKIGIVAATGSSWLINLLIPAIVGTIMVIGLKIYRNK